MKATTKPVSVELKEHRHYRGKGGLYSLAYCMWHNTAISWAIRPLISRSSQQQIVIAIVPAISCDHQQQLSPTIVVVIPCLLLQEIRRVIVCLDF